MRFRRTAAVAAAAVVMVGTAVGTGTDAAGAASTSVGASGCELGNGVKHVISLVFDNVHFARDNPNVPSDLEQMPHLLNFLKQNGTVLSNLHTPMIAHTADDSLAIYTGLYGDRHGQPLSNTTRPTTPTARPIRRRRSRTGPARWSTPRARADRRPRHHPDHGVLGHRRRRRRTPVSRRRRRGCRSPAPAARSVISRPRTWCWRTPARTSPPSSAPTRRRPRSSPPTPTRSRTPRSPTTSASRCTARRATRSAPNAQAVKFGQTTPRRARGRTCCPPNRAATPATRAVRRRYVAPVLGAGTPNLTHNGYPVTDANGDLTDLSGHADHEPVRHTAGLPRLQPDRVADARLPG